MAGNVANFEISLNAAEVSATRPVGAGAWRDNQNRKQPLSCDAKCRLQVRAAASLRELKGFAEHRPYHGSSGEAESLGLASNGTNVLRKSHKVM